MTTTQLTNVRVHGLGLTDDFLLQLSERSQTGKIEGATPASYGLPPHTSLEEAVQDAWDDARKAWEKYQKYPNDPWASWTRPLLKALDYSYSGQRGSGKYAPLYLSETGDVPLHYAPPTGPASDPKAADLDRVIHHGHGEGTLRTSPHGLMQGYLNATPEHLWGLVTNGEQLRLLRDNAQVTRAAYVEFNIADMMRSEDARAFRVLWLLLHRSRLKGAAKSPLEAWNTRASNEGVKARDSLRNGVEQAINHLGTGFLQANPDLLALTREDAQATTDLYRTCLKLVYQLVFLFVTEDRDLLFARDESGEYIPDAQTRERARYYLTRALRDKATTLNGNSLHFDAYAGWERLLNFVREGFAPLGLPALGSHLFALPERRELQNLKLSNRNFYDAIRALSEITVDGNRRPVNYAGLDSEELGSIYESLLELVPRLQPGPRFELQTLAGNERKTTGSYYTPSSLIGLLLESALDPVIEDAIRDKLPEDAIAALKGLKVIDPACGSGHFLIAAARRIGARLAELEEETSQPSPRALRKATRTVIAHCIYGADINPMAIELAKVALWLESQDAGKPLAFLDHRLRVGNSLLGTTPELMNSEDEIPEKVTKKSRQAAQSAVTLHLPDEAFVALEGDDKKTVAELKKGNKSERETAIRNALGQHSLFNMNEDLAPITAMVKALDKIEPESLSNVQAQESTWNAIQQNRQLQDKKLLADAWCAAFVLPKVPHAPAVTTATLHALKQNPQAERLNDVRGAVAEAARQYHFLHPHIEFPDVFGDAGKGGFDCVLGNPPWEKAQVEEVAFFSRYKPQIADLVGSFRKQAIEELESAEPELHEIWKRFKRSENAQLHYLKNSKRFNLSSRGKFNNYALFTELALLILNGRGKIGIIVPTGIATDDATKVLFSKLVNDKYLISLFDFENAKPIFQNVDRRFKFCLLSFGKEVFPYPVSYAFYCQDVLDLGVEGKKFEISSSDIKLINPNSGNAPTFRSSIDARINKSVYQRVPTMLNGGRSLYMGLSIWRLYNTTDDHKYFNDGDSAVPIIEAKMIHQYDHRFSEFTSSDFTPVDQIGKTNVSRLNKPRYFVDSDRFCKDMLSRNAPYDYNIVFRNVARATDERTMISSVIGKGASCEHTPYVTHSEDALSTSIIVSSMNSFIYDYLIRQKVGGISVSNFIVEQVPLFSLKLLDDEQRIGVRRHILLRVLELTYTAYDLTAFARDLGYGGDPFIWNDERRFWLRAELDALYFILYGIAREDVDYIMDTFPIVKRKDEAAHGSYRTKEAILSVYDELQTLGLERIGEYVSRVERLGLGGDVAGGWRP